MKWYLQSIIRAPHRYLPSSIRALKRKVVRFDETNGDGVLAQSLSLLRAIEKDGYSISGKIVLELGTGWEPIVPLLFYLKDARHIISIDRNRLLFPVSIIRSAEFLIKRADHISKEINVPVSVIKSKLAALGNGDLKSLLSAMKMDYRSPSDARRILQADDSVDIVFSHNVLEHIPPGVIREIFSEFRRILAPDGRMCHMIDNTDHWAHQDKTITYVNFLKFGDTLWNFFQINPLDYQNRLRHSEYLHLFEKTGFHILRNESWTDESLIPVIKSMKIHPRFRSFSVNDLATLCTFVVAVKETYENSTDVPEKTAGEPMEYWTESDAEKCVSRFSLLSAMQKKNLLDRLNHAFPPSIYQQHLACQRAAMANEKKWETVLATGRQLYPEVIKSVNGAASPADLGPYAVVLTAGGDGERLKASLRLQGVAEHDLENFTKATYQLPGFPKGWGSLQANLVCFSSLCRRAGIQIPVIVTTGPEGSTTHRVISDLIQRGRGFGLTDVRILAQDERLHLTLDGKIAYKQTGDTVVPITHPDETGGPFMKLKNQAMDGKDTALDWLLSRGCAKVIALQATALYDPGVICAMAAAGRERDCLGVGVMRTVFDPKDPFGSFVVLEKDGKKSLVVVEQAVRNEKTMSLKDDTGRFFLPYNTGLYVFDVEMLAANSLPDYATPPKEILPDLARSPKIGYAATDLVGLAKNGAVLEILPESYEVIKDGDDLLRLSDLARRCGLLAMCE